MFTEEKERNMWDQFRDSTSQVHNLIPLSYHSSQQISQLITHTTKKKLLKYIFKKVQPTGQKGKAGALHFHSTFHTELIFVEIPAPSLVNSSC
jgi:hypothetical protein